MDAGPANHRQWWEDAEVVGRMDRMRNFAIVAHVDHGKSTLCDRLMELSGAVSSRRPGGEDDAGQYLDTLMVERMRGITVKAQTCSIVHHHEDGEPYLLNLIDTPGHVDFSYEVTARTPLSLTHSPTHSFTFTHTDEDTHGRTYSQCTRSLTRRRSARASHVRAR